MMEALQTAGSYPPTSQAAVRTTVSPSMKGPPIEATSRFHGDGVRYKAKLIGVDPVMDAQGEKMCLDSMMKLKVQAQLWLSHGNVSLGKTLNPKLLPLLRQWNVKGMNVLFDTDGQLTKILQPPGFEQAARRQGKHKQRVWLKVLSDGIKIFDERTGVVLFNHDRTRISSLTKDESDPRALAYVFKNQDSHYLFYIKTANLAEPVLADIREVCQAVGQEMPKEPEEPPIQTNTVLLNNIAAPPAPATALEGVLSPHPETSSPQTNQTSSSDELMQVFSIQMQEPLVPPQAPCVSPPVPSEPPEPPEPPKPTLSTSQILSMFPTQPPGGSPYSSNPYSPATMPWGQQGPHLRAQWSGPAVAPWPTMPGGMGAWAPVAPPAGGQIQVQGPQPGQMGEENTPGLPAAVNGNPTAFNSFLGPSGATAPSQPVSSNLDSDKNLLDW